MTIGKTWRIYCEWNDFKNRNKIKEVLKYPKKEMVRKMDLVLLAGHQAKAAATTLLRNRG